MTSFSQEIKEIREFMSEFVKIDQTKFSELTEIPVATLQDWEAGINIPEPYLQKMILFFLGRLVISEMHKKRKERG